MLKKKLLECSRLIMFLTKWSSYRCHRTKKSTFGHHMKMFCGLSWVMWSRKSPRHWIKPAPFSFPSLVNFPKSVEGICHQPTKSRGFSCQSGTSGSEGLKGDWKRLTDLIPLFFFNFMNMIRHLLVPFDDCSLSTKHVVWAIFWGAMPISFFFFFFGTQFTESF